MQGEKRFGAFSSSADSQQLSLTVVSFVKVALSLAVGFGWISTVGAESTLTQIPVIVAAGLATWEGVQMLYGACRKVFYALYPSK